MHTIEKEILIEALYGKIWNRYIAGPYSVMIAAKGITKPCRLQFVCKGVGYAGRFYTYAPRIGVPMVEINTAYYNGGSTVELTTTIAHELAHYIQWILFGGSVQWHGPEFRSIMQSIGYAGLTYHSMSKRVAVATAQRSKDELFDF